MPDVGSIFRRTYRVFKRPIFSMSLSSLIIVLSSAVTFRNITSLYHNPILCEFIIAMLCIWGQDAGEGLLVWRQILFNGHYIGFHDRPIIDR
ncbi:hypothetical protein L211DRAFT_252204 [Terfezia boudieri ATCC MYA-4762]|uniref:Uncharacterized protein n=1 Tax=Terfezia boudieri ATCC MYA-4762 TaxID=1051890 RepID=A0A3N4M8E3_9PEZI|nr:hypothetical protein L211DRAFT_252204 [Terfezia boudieri ATCC MYA-4762]